MEGISDIRISGIDESRPPRLRKEPYINLYFRLNHKAPKRWCELFNDLLGKRRHQVKLDPDEGLFIDSWVRTPDEIAPLLEVLKEAVRRCSEEYIARIERENAAAAASGKSVDDDGEQGKLNRIIAGLNFDD